MSEEERGPRAEPVDAPKEVDWHEPADDPDEEPSHPNTTPGQEV